MICSWGCQSNRKVHGGMNAGWKEFIGGALLAAGLMFTGCGGAPTDDVAGRTWLHARTPSATGKQSYGSSEYYSDATYAKLVGTRGAATVASGPLGCHLGVCSRIPTPVHAAP